MIERKKQYVYLLGIPALAVILFSILSGISTSDPDQAVQSLIKERTSVLTAVACGNLRPEAAEKLLKQIEQDEVYIRPDVEIYLDEGGTLSFRWLEELPDVYFRDDLYAEYGAQKDKKTLAYIRKARRAFNDLASALAYRRLSIEQVMTCLLTRQEAIFSTVSPWSRCAKRTLPRKRASVRRR